MWFHHLGGKWGKHSSRRSEAFTDANRWGTHLGLSWDIPTDPFWEPTFATKPWIAVGSIKLGDEKSWSWGVEHPYAPFEGCIGREWFFGDCWRLTSFNKYWKKLLIFCKVCHRYGDILLAGCCGPFSLTWWIKSKCFRDATLTENLLPKTEFPWRFAHPTSVYYK